MVESEVSSLERLSDEELVQRIQTDPVPQAAQCRDALFRRYHTKVAVWSLRWTRDREEARDLAQEVFLRLHQRLDTFRGKSRFSTWLYTIMRSVAINRSRSATRRSAVFGQEQSFPESIDPGRSAEESVAIDQILQHLRQAMARDLEPLEAKILYLHHVHGMTLPAITRLLELENKSGAKAFVVSGKRKLERGFGRWLRRQVQDGNSVLEGLT